MNKLHNFMDKMRQRPVEERRRLLFAGMVVLGGIVLVLGIWNISSKVVALGGSVDVNNLAAIGSQK